MLTTAKQVGFRFRRNLSGPTAGFRRLSCSEFQTVRPAEAKNIAGVGDRQRRSGHTVRYVGA